MSYEHVIDIVRQTFWVVVQIAGPLLLVIMIVGLLVSILQSVTQIHDMTLTFVPKMFVFVLSFIFLLPWILKIIIKYTHEVLIYHWDKIISYVY
jgi:flagellar biosynthesis protein FliQ